MNRVNLSGRTRSLSLETTNLTTETLFTFPNVFSLQSRYKYSQESCRIQTPIATTMIHVGEQTKKLYKCSPCSRYDPPAKK